MALKEAEKALKTHGEHSEEYKIAKDLLDHQDDHEYLKAYAMKKAKEELMK